MTENIFSTENAENIFKPLLRKLSELRELADRKIVAYLIGNNQNKIFELAKFLEKISREDMRFTKIFAIKFENPPTEEIENDIDELQIKIRELKFDDDDEGIVLLVGNEIFLSGNIFALADYSVAIQTAEEKISSFVNEIWQLQADGNFLKIEDDEDEEDFIENLSNGL